MNITFGILAHVDAGKTTLSEQILYHGHAIRTCGRVDTGDSFLDTEELERKRGITIYSGQAFFLHGQDTYYLIDTPGHIDFSAEMERTLEILDYAVLLINGSDGIQGHTDTIWHLLERYKIPVFIFVNKLDLASSAYEPILCDLKRQFSDRILDFSLWSGEQIPEQLLEVAAESDDKLLEAYLSNSLNPGDAVLQLRRLIRERKLFPCFGGSALQGSGIAKFLDLFYQLTETFYSEHEDAPFCGRVYKIRYDAQGERLSYLKVLKGFLHVKDTVGEEKIHQLRACQGGHYESCKDAGAGAIVVAVGLKDTKAGEMIGECREQNHYSITPSMQARVLYPPEVSDQTVIKIFSQINEEDPMLSYIWEESLHQLTVSMMGKIQLEVLEQEIQQRFHIPVSFGQPEVLYKETVREAVTGYGHFEPLRHYAEAVLRLEPMPRDSGITFSSECHVDELSANFQSLIRARILGATHKGVLIGADLTDVHVVLLHGISHIKHTEGGDFREAVDRAIRQALMKTECQLLEPYQPFSISVPDTHVGRVLTDIHKYCGTFDPPVIADGLAFIRGCGPVSTFMNYSEELAILTRGKGNISFRTGHYDLCHNAEEVIDRKGYRPDGDLDHPSCSVFCQKGTSFIVNWDQAESYMHYLKR